MRSRPVHRLVTPVLLTVLAFSTTTASGQKLLRWKFAAGESFQLRVTQQLKMEAEILDQPISTSADMQMDLKWTVKDVDDQGTARLDQTFERMTVTMDAPGVGVIQYDSASEEEPAGLVKTLAASIEPLVGATFQQRFSARGEVLETKPSAEAAAALARMPGGSRMAETFSEEGMTKLFKQAAAALPTAPVKPGDTWQTESMTESPSGPLKTIVTYTYLGSEPRNGATYDKIAVSTQLTFVRGEGDIGPKVSVQDQSGSGVMYFDSTAGRFVETQLKQKMTLATSLGNRVVEQKMDVATRMTVTEAVRR